MKKFFVNWLLRLGHKRKIGSQWQSKMSVSQPRYLLIKNCAIGSFVELDKWKSDHQTFELSGFQLNQPFSSLNLIRPSSVCFRQ
jgi:hypothetical protein